MALKVWNGSSWVTATGLKVWNGSSWVTASNGKVWNGSAWTSFFTSATVAIDDLQLTASVGAVFNGQAYTSLTFNTDGTLSYSCSVLNSGIDAYVEIQNNGIVIESAAIAIAGNVSGMWKLSGNASDYQIYVAKSGTWASISGATNNGWTNMGAGAITLYVDTAVNDAIDQTFNISIRNASTLAVLDSAVITMNALAAGIN